MECSTTTCSRTKTSLGRRKYNGKGLTCEEEEEAGKGGTGLAGRRKRWFGEERVLTRESNGVEGRGLVWRGGEDRLGV